MKAYKQIEKLRHPKNLIKKNKNNSFNIWLIEEDNKWIIGFSKYVGPRYIRATVVLQIITTCSIIEGKKILNDIETSDSEYVNHAMYINDDEVFRYFKNGIKEILNLDECNFKVSILNFIFEDVESSLMSFKLLGNIVGEQLNLRY